MGHIIEQIQKASGLSMTLLADRSGLARSTQYRIRDGVVDPTLGSLRELAFAGGFDVDIQLVPLSDPDAGRAARALLDSRFESVETAAVKEWKQRLRRWAPDGDPIEIARAAGQSSSLLKRKNAVFLRGSLSELKLASAGAFTKSPWVLSGAAVLDRIAEIDTARKRGTMVAYSADLRRFERVLDHVERVRPDKANLILAEYTDDLEEDSWEDAQIRLVAPIQGLIDAFGIGGSLADAADQIARSW